MIALVTGGTRGIGLATAHALTNAGFQVIIGARSTPSDLPSNLAHIHMDVSDSTSIESGFSEIESMFGSVDVLVANAGVTQDTLLMRMSDDDIESVIQTNLVGSIFLARRAVRGMIKKRYGRIILMSSVVGMLGSAGQVNYSASKAGLVGVARSLTREIGSRGITVNVIAPGFIETAMTSDLSMDTRDQILQSIPAARYGTPEDVAQLVVFLASSQASYISGAVIPVDGGLGMGH
jgi:3-oxoacyl-[acyl-carrier protein] reductase